MYVCTCKYVCVDIYIYQYYINVRCDPSMIFFFKQLSET